MATFSLNSVFPSPSLARPASAGKPAADSAAGPTTSNLTGSTGTATTANRGPDAVELSAAASFLGTEAGQPNSELSAAARPVRSELVARLKSQIDSGTYDLDSKKLDKVATGILRDIGLKN